MNTDSYYDLSSYDADEERENDPQGPPMVNLCAAAAYVGSLLESSHVYYAVLGGFAMVCRGSPRTTSDIDIATTATMRQLWTMVEPKPGKVLPRLIIPNTKLLDKIIRVFVRTGPSYGDKSCEIDRLIEVDISVFGGGSGPADLSQHIEPMEVKLGEFTFEINVLDIYFMMRTKLRTLTARAAARDFEDLEFLLTNFAPEVKRISSKLDYQDRALFMETNVVQSRGVAIVKQCNDLLSM